MSSAQTPTGFSLYDLSTRIIPGIAISASLYFLLLVSTESIPSSISQAIPTRIIIPFIIMSYIFGEAINTLRLNLLDVPWYFHRLVMTETQRDPDYGIIGRLRNYTSTSNKPESVFSYKNNNVVDIVYQRFTIDEENILSINDLFSLIQSDLSDGMTEKTKRLRLLYEFISNMKIAGVGSAIIILYTILIEFGLPLLGFIFVLIIGVFIILTGYVRIVGAGKQYVDSLLMDYFVKVYSQN